MYTLARITIPDKDALEYFMESGGLIEYEVALQTLRFFQQEGLYGPSILLSITITPTKTGFDLTIMNNIDFKYPEVKEKFHEMLNELVMETFISGPTGKIEIDWTLVTRNSGY